MQKGFFIVFNGGHYLIYLSCAIILVINSERPDTPDNSSDEVPSVLSLSDIHANRVANASIAEVHNSRSILESDAGRAIGHIQRESLDIEVSPSSLVELAETVSNAEVRREASQLSSGDAWMKTSEAAAFKESLDARASSLPASVADVSVKPLEGNVNEADISRSNPPPSESKPQQDYRSGLEDSVAEALQALIQSSQKNVTTVGNGSTVAVNDASPEEQDEQIAEEAMLSTSTTSANKALEELEQNSTSVLSVVCFNYLLLSLVALAACWIYINAQSYEEEASDSHATEEQKKWWRLLKHYGPEKTAAGKL
jgi:hypothetical protein